MKLTKIPPPQKRHENAQEEQDEYRIEFTRDRSRQTEWYAYLDTTTTDEGISMRCAKFQHVATGKYLQHVTEHDDSTSIMIGDQDDSCNESSSIWLMRPVPIEESLVSEPHSPPPQASQNPQKRRSSDSIDISSSNSISWEYDSPDKRMSRRPSIETDSRCVQYFLIPKGMSNQKLSCTKSMSVESSCGLELCTATSDEDAAIWELEFTSGELCFISNPVIHNQIRCNVFGKLSLSTSFQGWEVFRFIEVGNGHVAISSWTHTRKFLSSDPDGRVFTSENRRGHWEKWQLEKTSPNGVFIISVAHPGRYLSIGRVDGEALQTTTRPNDFSLWHIDAAHCNTYFLSSITTSPNNKKQAMQVSSRRKGPFLSPHRRGWEEWKMERSPQGDVTFYSKAHEKYLGCNSQGDLHTTTYKGDWVLWEIEESPYGGIYLKSKAHHCYMSIKDGQLCTAPDSTFGESETFRMEPRLPPTISGPKLAALGLAGAVGLALTVAVPYAVVGVLEVAGVAATELSLLAGSGAILGASVMGTTAIVVKNEARGSGGLLPTSAEINDDYLMTAHRPISAWRTWSLSLPSSPQSNNDR